MDIDPTLFVNLRDLSEHIKIEILFLSTIQYKQTWFKLEFNKFLTQRLKCNPMLYTALAPSK